MLSLTYVSRPTDWTKSREETLEEIRAVSTARNTELNITGLLIATFAYFAHVLEGPESSINMVMASIMADPRHSHIVVLDRTSIALRRFPFWRLAQFERETFADQAVTPLLATLHAGDDDKAFGRFTHLTDAVARNQREERSNRPRPGKRQNFLQDETVIRRTRPCG